MRRMQNKLSRSRPLSGQDIFKLLKASGNTDIFSGPTRARKKPLREKGFTCDQLHNALLRVSLEVHAGIRQKPDRGALKAELGQRLGVGAGAVAQALQTRCASDTALYENVSTWQRGGFTRQESAAVRARLARERTLFSCEDLEEVLRSTTDHRGLHIAALLSQRAGKPVAIGTFFSAVKKRCRHLLPMWKPVGTGRGGRPRSARNIT